MSLERSERELNMGFGQKRVKEKERKKPASEEGKERRPLLMVNETNAKKIN